MPWTSSCTCREWGKLENSANQLTSLLHRQLLAFTTVWKGKSDKTPHWENGAEPLQQFLGEFVLNYLLDSEGSNFCWKQKRQFPDKEMMLCLKPSLVLSPAWPWWLWAGQQGPVSPITSCLPGRFCCPPTWWWHHCLALSWHHRSTWRFAGKNSSLQGRMK